MLGEWPNQSSKQWGRGWLSTTRATFLLLLLLSHPGCPLSGPLLDPQSLSASWPSRPAERWGRGLGKQGEVQGNRGGLLASGFTLEKILIPIYPDGHARPLIYAARKCDCFNFSSQVQSFFLPFGNFCRTSRSPPGNHPVWMVKTPPSPTVSSGHPHSRTKSTGGDRETPSPPQCLEPSSFHLKRHQSPQGQGPTAREKPLSSVLRLAPQQSPSSLLGMGAPHGHLTQSWARASASSALDARHYLEGSAGSRSSCPDHEGM